MNGQWSMPWMAELEENKRAAALAAGEDPKTPSTGTPADTQPNTPIPGKHTHLQTLLQTWEGRVIFHAYCCSLTCVEAIILRCVGDFGRRLV